MRVVHVNAYDGNGGAGRAMMRLHAALKQKGVHSDALCMYQFDPASDVTPVYRNLPGKLRSIAAIFTERYLVKALTPGRGIPFSLQRFGLPVRRHPLIRRADIIHLHWVNHGMLAPRQIRQLLETGKPVVWSLHDCNPFTGGCHVRYDCRHYEVSCGKCPALNSDRSNDLSHKTWEAKARAYHAGRINWIAPSEWMGESVRKASLAGDDPVEVIGNALDTTVFQPLGREACRHELGIPGDAFVLLAGHMPSSTDRHKGAAELRLALKRFREREDIDHGKVLLVFFGGSERVEWPYPVHFAGKIGDEATLAKYYTAANVFLFPSLQESMGYTALESLACGTPVVAFRTSGVTDVVLHRENGYLAETGNTDEFAEGIAWIYHYSAPEQLAASGRTHAITRFDADVVAEKHLILYNRLLREYQNMG